MERDFHHKRPRRALRLTAAVILLVTGSAPSLAQAPAGGDADADFSAQFDHVDLPAPMVEAEAGAVDIAAIAPPLEQAPAASPLGTGTASYYGRKFHGRRTASGERFDMTQFTAAHRTLPFGSLVQVTNPRNGRSVTVRINDRGPFSRNRVIDLSRAAAEEIGLVARGHGPVELALVDD